MRPGWVAGALRGRMLAARRLDPSSRHAMDGARGLDEALLALGGSTYGHRLNPGMSLVEAQREVGETTLWHLRVLGGWLPPGGGEDIRTIAGWFEMQNLVDHVASLAFSESRRESYHLGSLSSVWRKAAETTTLGNLRALLAVSPWGNPGGDDFSNVVRGVRVGWGRRLAEAFPERVDWGAGFIAVELAKDLFLTPSVQGARLRYPLEGMRHDVIETLADLTAALPRQASWVLAGIDRADELWMAEETWWARVAEDAGVMVHDRHLSRASIIGVSMSLVVDCRLIHGLLAAAWRRSGDRDRAHADA